MLMYSSCLSKQGDVNMHHLEIKNGVTIHLWAMTVVSKVTGYRMFSRSFCYNKVRYFLFTITYRKKWGTPHLLFNTYWGLIPHRQSAHSMQLIIDLHLVSRLRMGEVSLRHNENFILRMHAHKYTHMHVHKHAHNLFGEQHWTHRV